jgi:ferrous iron transport protein A
VSPNASAGLRTGVRTLAGMKPGSRGVVRGIHIEAQFNGRLLDLGLVPGTIVLIVRRAPLGDPMELVVRGTHFSIRRSEASLIHVDPL